MPHVLDVICPDCRGPARFEFATGIPVDRKDRDWFRRSRAFEMRKVERHDGARHVVAMHYRGLRGPSLDVISDMPAAHSPADWHHSRYHVRTTTAHEGTVTCSACALRRKHRLDWPRDAWFQIEYRGRVLWAFDRDMALRLLSHIQGKMRPSPDAQLLKVPAHFRTAKARNEVARRLRARLAPGPLVARRLKKRQSR